MKTPSLAIIPILGACLFSTLANSASFDCDKASTWVEKTICDNAALSKLDNAMAKKYKQNIAHINEYADSEMLKKNAITNQRLWLKFQRNTCQDTACLMREYQEYIEEKITNGATWRFTNELSHSNLPSKNAFGDFSKTAQIAIYNSEIERWEDTGETKNTVSIHSVANKPYLAIIEGVLLFTNAHTCDIGESKGIWFENHWVVHDSQQDENSELHLYPAANNGKTQLLLKDTDNKYKALHCGMRGYFDGIVLERE